MRVTDGAILDGMKRNLGAARARAVAAQQSASDGMKVRTPGDDPTAFAQARRMRSREALANAGEQSAQSAHDTLSSADSALNSAGEIMTRIREIALQGASDTVDARQRSDLGIEVGELKKQLLNLANTDVDGKFVFGGNIDSGKGVVPFADDGSYHGDVSARELQAFPGVRVQTSLTGGSAFGANTGNDVFSTIDALSAALQSGPGDAVQSTLTEIDNSYNRMVTARTQVGGMMDSLDMAKAVANRYGFDAKTTRSQLTETDEITAASDLMKATSAYNASIAAAQQLPLNGLIGKAT